MPSPTDLYEQWGRNVLFVPADVHRGERLYVKPKEGHAVA